MPNQIRRKFLIPVILIFFLIIALAGTHLFFFWGASVSADMSNSPNKKATFYFVNSAVVNTVWIELVLHRFLPYDHILMKPLIVLQDSLYEKGKRLVKEDNAEDVVWWCFINCRIKGVFEPLRDNEPLAYYNQPFDEAKEFHDKLYENILRLSEHKVYGGDFIQKYKYYYMEMMASSFTDTVNAVKTYEGSSYERYTQRFFDLNMKRRVEEIHEAFVSFFKENGVFDGLSMQEKVYYYRTKLMIEKVNIYSQMKRLEIKYIHDCDDEYVNGFVDTANDLYAINDELSSNDEAGIQMKVMISRLFNNRYSVDGIVALAINNSCQNLDTNHLIAKMQQHD